MWRRTTDRNWPQFTIRPTNRKWFDLDHRPDFEAFRPAGIPYEVLPPADWHCHQLTGVTVAELAAAAGAGRLVLFHVSDRYDIDGWRALLAEARAVFPAATFPDHWGLGE